MRKLFFRKCLMVFKLDLNLSAFAEGSSYNKNLNSCLTYTCNNCLHIDTQSFHRGGSRGRVQEVHTLPPPQDVLWLSNSTGILQKNYVAYWCWNKTWDEVEWRTYVKRHKHGILSRHITSQLRHSLVVHPLLRKILDPPLFHLLYYYMRHFCNLIGLEQWYFSLI